MRVNTSALWVAQVRKQKRRASCQTHLETMNPFSFLRLSSAGPSADSFFSLCSANILDLDVWPFLVSFSLCVNTILVSVFLCVNETNVFHPQCENCPCLFLCACKARLVKSSKGQKHLPRHRGSKLSLCVNSVPKFCLLCLHTVWILFAGVCVMWVCLRSWMFKGTESCSLPS